MYGRLTADQKWQSPTRHFLPLPTRLSLGVETHWAECTRHREKACDDCNAFERRIGTLFIPSHALCIRLSSTTLPRPHPTPMNHSRNPIPIHRSCPITRFASSGTGVDNFFQPLTILFPLHESMDLLGWRLYNPSFNVSFPSTAPREKERVGQT